MHQTQSVFLYLTLLVSFLGGHYCESDGVRNCKDIQTLRQTIFWIGLLKTRFILITNSYAVFDLSPSAVDNVNFKVQLGGSVPLEKAYPVLGEKKGHEASGFFGKNNFKRLTVIDETGEYLYAEREQQNGKQKQYRGMLYNFEKNTVDEYDVKDDMLNGGVTVITLSSVDSLYFYAIYYYSSSDKSGQLLRGAFKDRNTLRESTTLQQEGKLYYLCLVDTANDKIVLQKDSCSYGTADWNPLGGFADDYNFYLLATNRTVMVFPKSAFASHEVTQVQFTRVRYEDFFVCGSNGIADNWVVFAIIGAVFALILLGGCCFFICRQRSRGALINSQQQQQQQQQSMNTKQQQPQQQQQQQQQPVGLNLFAATQQQPLQQSQQQQQQQASSKSKSQKSRKSKNRSTKSSKRSNKSRKSTKKKGTKKR